MKLNIMRGKKSSLEEKINKGTINKTREKRKSEIANNTNPEVAAYLNKTQIMLDLLWKKLSDINIQDNAEQLEKYSKLFILWQKHYFSHLSYVPKDLKNDDIISKLIDEKEM